MRGLTEKQRRVFEFVKSYITERGRPPTIREIGNEFNMSSTGSVRDVLRALAKKDFIKQDPGFARGIRIKAGPGPLTGDIADLPIVDRIEPGLPVINYENIKKSLKLDRSIVPDGEIFVFEINDNSMLDAGIKKGDKAFVRKEFTCRPGQIVAVVYNNKIKLREFSKKGQKIHLLAKKKGIKPIMFNPEEFGAALLGVLVSLYKRY